MHRLILSLALLSSMAVAQAAPGSVILESTALNRLSTLEADTPLEFAAFPVGPGLSSKMRFQRIDVYAPGARIIVIDENGEREIPKSDDIQLIGYSTDGQSRVALTFDKSIQVMKHGAGTGPDGAFVVRTTKTGERWKFDAIRAEAALPKNVVPQFIDNEDSLPSPLAEADLLDHLRPTAALAVTPVSIATIAVDTDTSFMTKRFGGNEAQATAWIASLFTTMNVIYRRDLNVILKQGTTFLRPTTDPYANADSSATSAQLNEFGNYWQSNYSSGANAVTRSFAMLLSGNSSNGNSASGIAWVNSYCRTPGNGGSYSVNQIFTNSGIGIELSTSIVAHELGHNFGASHTHCSSATDGSAPVATGTIDQCYNGQSGTGCYAGVPSCPSSGPGAPRGSLMSYCHIGGANGASGCGQSVLQFHPTHITQLRNRVAANTPSCLQADTIIFAHGFEP
jgi:hypothetical protein